jgi:uncharacterized small protein (DUF1192 family)
MTSDRRGFNDESKQTILTMKHDRRFHDNKTLNEFDKASSVCVHQDSRHESCHSLDLDQLSWGKEVVDFPEFSEDFGDFGDFSTHDSSDWQFPSKRRERISSTLIDPREKLRAQGFNWNKAKVVRMLSCRSLRKEYQNGDNDDDNDDDDDDDDDVDTNGSDEGEDLSTIYSVGTDYTMTTQGTEWSDVSMSNHSSMMMDKDVAEELEKLSEAELAERFVKLQKKLERRRRRKLRKSKSRGHFEKSKYLSLGSDDEI